MPGEAVWGRKELPSSGVRVWGAQRFPLTMVENLEGRVSSGTLPTGPPGGVGGTPTERGLGINSPVFRGCREVGAPPQEPP